MKSRKIGEATIGDTRSAAWMAAVLAVFAAGLPFAAAAEPDGTLVNTGAYLGTTWGKTTLWAGGEVVSGNGVVIDTGTGSPEVRMDETNRIVGAFTSTRGTMPAAGGIFYFSIVNNGFTRTFDFTPPRAGTTTGFVLTTNKLIFANNGSPAEIRIDDGTGDGGGTRRQPYRHFYDVPIVLQDDLVIRHLFDSTNQYGHYTVESSKGPAAGVIFPRGISGDGKGITIKNAAPNMGVMFTADNTFSGDLVVESGVARAIDTYNRPRAGTPFGVDNKVVATNDSAGVDLGGFTTGEGQTLVLKGKRLTDASHTNGVLFSTYGRMDEYSKWLGAVQLVGDTWIGGTLSGFGYPRNFYPVDADGDLEVSGSISEIGGPVAVHLVSSRNVVFGGMNTFSGGLYIDKGFFTARTPESVGTGGIVFSGGTYRAERQSDASVFEMDVAGAPNQLRVHVEDGVTNVVVPSWSGFGMGDFYKYGEGTLLLTNMVSLVKKGFIYGGTVIFDTSKANYVKFGVNDNNWQMNQVYLYQNAKIVVRGDPATPRTGCWYGNLDHNSAVTLRVEDGQNFRLSPSLDNNLCGFINLETDASGAYFSNLSVNGHTYAGSAPVVIYEGSSFVSVSDGKNVPMPDEAYANTWGGATDCVDVTPALAATSVPDGTSTDVIRFNTPNGGSELVLRLDGDLTVAGRTILVTPAMGSTAVRITGGALVSSTALRILNFNTNAPLIIESDVAAGDSGKLNVGIGGPGKVVFSGAKSFNCIVYVNGGELEVDCADSLGVADTSKQWNANYVYISGGGILSFAGTFRTISDATARTSLGLIISSSGGALKVPNAADTVTLERTISLYAGARFCKLGPGTLKFSTRGSDAAQFQALEEGGRSPRIMRTEFLEGIVEQDCKFSESTQCMIVDNGVTLVGARWLQANQAGANGGGNRMELASRRMLHVGSGGATVDVHGASVTINDASYYYQFDRCPEFLSGDGELVVVDTVGGASINPSSYRDASFRGKFTSYVPVSSSSSSPGFEFRNAEWHIPAGVTHTVNRIRHDRGNVRFGRLSGSGTLYVTGTQDYFPAYLFVGQDDAPDADFAGVLTLEKGSNGTAYPQLVKVGNNAQRISGSANRLDGNTVVRAGSLLAGNDSSGTQGAGAFGAAMIFVGDEETPAGASPAFLADGAFTVANEVRVPDTLPRPRPCPSSAARRTRTARCSRAP